MYRDIQQISRNTTKQQFNMMPLVTAYKKRFIPQSYVDLLENVINNCSAGLLCVYF